MKKLAVVCAFVLLSFPCMAQQSAGCGISAALDVYDKSERGFADATIPIKTILVNIDDTPPYSTCNVPELRRADSFFNDVVQFILQNGRTPKEQEAKVLEIHGYQLQIRKEVRRQILQQSAS
jgi:hypothetical protein